jgi:hypothetical protein
MEDQFATYDAAYVLGALSPSDRRAYEEHLSECASCAEAVAELAGMPGLLARVPISEVMADEPPEPVPPSLLPRMANTIARRRRRTRWITGGSALAAAAALIVLLVLVFVPGGSSTPGNPSPNLAGTSTKMTALVPISMKASVQVADVAWGSKINLHCLYEPSIYVDRTYTLTITDKQKHTQQVASWTALPGKQTLVAGSTAVHRADIASIDIRDDSGQPLLSATP